MIAFRPGLSLPLGITGILVVCQWPILVSSRAKVTCVYKNRFLCFCACTIVRSFWFRPLDGLKYICQLQRGDPKEVSLLVLLFSRKPFFVYSLSLLLSCVFVDYMWFGSVAENFALTVRAFLDGCRFVILPGLFHDSHMRLIKNRDLDFLCAFSSRVRELV